MRPFGFPCCRWVLLAVCGCGLLGLASCKSRVKLVPVSGTVKVEGHLLSKGVVSFVPDKENPIRLVPSGTIKEDGSYELSTQGKSGAPLGHYTVTVTVPSEFEAAKNQKITLPTGKPATRSVNPTYGDPDTSPLAIEVAESPQAGAYDLALTDRPEAKSSKQRRRSR